MAYRAFYEKILRCLTRFWIRLWIAIPRFFRSFEIACIIVFTISNWDALILSFRRPLSYRNQSIALLCKLVVDRFLHDRDLRHERVSLLTLTSLIWIGLLTSFRFTGFSCLNSDQNYFHVWKTCFFLHFDSSS